MPLKKSSLPTPTNNTRTKELVTIIVNIDTNHCAHNDRTRPENDATARKKTGTVT
jgi:hypothetical protein